MKALKIFAFLLVAFLLLGSAPDASALGKQTVTLVDPASIPNLYWETDLTPIHEIQVPGQPAKVVQGWGWGFGYSASFADAPTKIEPLGMIYSSGEVTGRSWSEWGIPGEEQKWQISLIAPPEYPRELSYMTPDGGVYTGKLIAGAIPVYNLVGDTVVRSLVWIWKDNGKIAVKTWVVAVGHLVPADGAVFAERIIPTNSKMVWTEFKGGQISDAYLAKVGTYQNADGWTTTHWVLKSVAVKTAQQGTIIFGGSLSYLEATPYEAHPWYQKSVSDTWDPARLIGESFCPYDPLTVYLWGGPCE